MTKRGMRPRGLALTREPVPVALHQPEGWALVKPRLVPKTPTLGFGVSGAAKIALQVMPRLPSVPSGRLQKFQLVRAAVPSMDGLKQSGPGSSGIEHASSRTTSLPVRRLTQAPSESTAWRLATFAADCSCLVPAVVPVPSGVARAQCSSRSDACVVSLCPCGLKEVGASQRQSQSTSPQRSEVGFRQYHDTQLVDMHGPPTVFASPYAAA
ncbi:hypothetical protein W97_04538 [Coniosporium apollinis CBS 100218]|uniref:Uncharacterized protein n=1 Tax=Coniosporium apollinis (strain CBS 100218) TaxID=1168221 RepID=R7YTT3_CONA1|nr:uncharacterized protein W97_04538 [Coniosporium apollinis CBS 100218]EON65300.1 hypothetical protein W97_04538 [Coniosporium apollinis CBS 100218]